MKVNDHSDWDHRFTNRDLFDLFGECVTMACFQAYFDESGVHRGSKWTVVGGAVGKRSSWSTMTAAWRAVLDKCRVAEFHATDLANFKGEYADWNEDKRRRLVGRLLRVINGEPIIPLAMAVKNDTFREVALEFPDFPITAYQFCCEWAVLKIITLAEKKRRMIPVAVTFESGQQANSPYMLAFDPARFSVERQQRLGIGRVNFVQKKNVLPLQVADLIVYETWKEVCATEKDPMKNVRYPLQRLVEGHREWLGGVVEKDKVREYLRAMRDFCPRPKSQQKSQRSSFRTGVLLG